MGSDASEVGDPIPVGLPVEVPESRRATPPPLPRVLSKEDRLEAENIQLRIQIQMGLVEKAEQDYVQRSQGLSALMNARSLLQHTLADRYNIDFTREQIEPETGRIIPAPTPAVELPASDVIEE